MPGILRSMHVVHWLSFCGCLARHNCTLYSGQAPERLTACHLTPLVRVCPLFHPTRYGIEANDAGLKYLSALETVKAKEMSIMDLQKEIGDAETRLRQQQNLYESVRAERNAYSKNLVEAQDEIQEMKRKFKIMQHQIEQLKEEISAKDLALVKEHFDHMKVEKEKDSLKVRAVDLSRCAAATAAS